MRSGDQLQGKVALITGGGGEIGGAIARQFALQGASVMLAELRPEAAAATVADIAAAGGKAASVICDVARETDAGRAVAETVAAFGRLDILVNTAAAMTPDGTCETLTLDQWAQALAVNLTAPFFMCRHAVPELRKAGGGAIINIASQLGQIGVAGRAPYSTTKAALIQLTKCLAADHARDGIRVNSLSPGAINTARSTRRYGSRENANKVRGPAHLLGRMGRPDEIAAGALYLASADSSFVTGTDLLVDGGYLAFKGSLTDS